MERRNFLASLASIPLWARPALPSEQEKTGVQHYLIPPKPPFDSICACSFTLHPTMFRAARDFWGEDCEVVGHPAQKAAWNMARILMGNPAYSVEWNEAQDEYFMGKEFTADYTMPMDRIDFRRNGKIMGWIYGLAIPTDYVSML